MVFAMYIFILQSAPRTVHESDGNEVGPNKHMPVQLQVYES